jgi:hypothetical protein
VTLYLQLETGVMETEGVDVDSEGNIYVADRGNFRIQVLSHIIWSTLIG